MCAPICTRWFRLVPAEPLSPLACADTATATTQTWAVMRRSLDAASVLSSDDLSDYDVISSSDGHRSLDSSIADLGHVHAPLREPPPLAPARDRFDTAALAPDDIQAYVQNAVPAAAAAALVRGADGELRTVRVYVDGVWDPFQAR